jgi:hypothetical protein
LDVFGCLRLGHRQQPEEQKGRGHPEGQRPDGVPEGPARQIGACPRARVASSDRFMPAKASFIGTLKKTVTPKQPFK